MNALKALLVVASFTWAQIAAAAPPIPTTWNIDGVERKALVFPPTARTASGTHPLIFAFHGHGGTMRATAQWGLQERWPEAIVVCPQGLPTPNKRDPEGQKPGWQPEAGAEGDRDLKFFDAMLATLRGKYQIDDRQIYATGFSNGAFFSLLLWNQRSDVFAGFAIVAGALPPSMSLPAARPVLHIAGRKDPIVTFDRAEAAIAEERRVDEATAEGENCGEGCTLYHGGKAEVKVAIHPGGHIYPSFAAEMTVDFFKGLNAAPRAAASPGAAPKAEVIHYTSHGLELTGYVYRPPGDGPFPVYVWNHGSEREPHPGAVLAAFWVPHGFVLFAPLRSGHGRNPGDYIGDEQKKIRDSRSAAGFREVAALHERANDDVVAACQWIAGQPFVDPKRIVVAGGSYGGIQTLLTAERNAREHLGIKCFVAMSPAAESWGNPNWAGRLTTAINAADAPIFLLQAHNDYNLGPSEVLGPQVDARGFPSRHKIFPPHGDPQDHAQGHGGFFSDAAAWEEDVLKYLHDCGETTPLTAGLESAPQTFATKPTEK